MTDARYPEQWLNDRRFLKLSDSAHRTVVTLLAWSASNRTDGYFDADDVAFTPHAKTADFTELVAAGLLTTKDKGWVITVYRMTQTSAAQLAGAEAGRRADREKKARQRAHKAGNHSLCRPDTCPVVPRDVPRDTKDRQGQDRQGALDGTQSEPAGEVKCTVCKFGLDPVLASTGETTHPTCEAS